MRWHTPYPNRHRITFVQAPNFFLFFVSSIEMKCYLEDAKRLVYSADGSRVYNPNERTIWVKIDDQVLEIEPGHDQL